MAARLLRLFHAGRRRYDSLGLCGLPREHRADPGAALRPAWCNRPVTPNQMLHAENLGHTFQEAYGREL